MPYSDSRFDKAVEKFIKTHTFKDYFDIGSGAGKYGKMIRDVYPDANIIGVEADKSYINEFKLKNIYSDIHHESIEHFMDRNPDFQTELVIIGDCLEHLKKSDGIDLINFFIYRAKYILVIYPTKCIQYSWQGHSTEAHRSVWNIRDFSNFKAQIFKKDFMNLVILRGYIGDPMAITVDD